MAVPAKVAPGSVLEAAAAGMDMVVCITEGIPAQDEARVYSQLRHHYPSIRLIGPNCPGLISPGKCNIGITAGEIALAGGPVGIVSRSGTLTYQALYELKQMGIGVTTCVGIGGDPVPGTDLCRLPGSFPGRPRHQGGNADRRDRRHRGRKGGRLHLRARHQAGGRYIAGVTAPPGRRMGHAGAIISGNKGTAQAKMEALAEAGVKVAQNPTEAGELMAEVVRGL